MRNVVYWLWLYHVLGPCNAKFMDLLATFETAENIYEARREPELLLRLSPGEREAVERTSLDSAEKQAAACRGAGYEMVSYGTAHYPLRLCNTRIPPMILFVSGQVDALEPVFAVAGVGARFSTEYGRAAVKHICTPLARAGVTLISGMALGIDAEVHRAAMMDGASTIAVLGTAIDVTYPAAHRKLRADIEQHGAVVSEYPPDAEGHRAMFAQRNRIISGLAQAVIVFEAARKSGTMITASWAKEDGRKVFSVPGSILSPHSEGTNILIKQGVAPVLEAGDIFEALHIKMDQPETPEQLAWPAKAGIAGLSEVQRRIYNALGEGEQLVDELAARVKLAPYEVLAELTELEMEGLVVSQGGSRYARRPDAPGGNI